MVIIITEIIMIHSRAGILPHVSRNAETSQHYVPREGTVRSTNITPTPRLNPESCPNVWQIKKKIRRLSRSAEKAEPSVESASLGDGGQITADQQPPINVLHHYHLLTVTVSRFHNYTKWKETHHMTRIQYFFTTTQHKTPFHSWHKTKEH